MGLGIASVLWGFAEATLFFIVPDVLLSYVGLKNLRKGLLACLFALLGALLGGSIMYFWGRHSQGEVLRVLNTVPAISTDMLASVRTSLDQQGLWAMFLGPLSGIPYKTYAAQAASTGISYHAFILASIPARLVRFILVTICCHYAARYIVPVDSRISPVMLLLSGWLIFYTFYFLRVAG
jgi:membrane protein YqaA with SNARE-associated domain